MGSGPALSLEIGRQNVSNTNPFVGAVAFGLLHAASFGAAGWLARDSQFGVNFGILSAIGFVAAYLIVGPPPTDMNSGHPRIDKAVLKRAAFRGASIGLAAVLSGAIHKEHHALSYGVEVGLVTGISSGLLVALAPSVEAWVDNLPDRRLGGVWGYPCSDRFLVSDSSICVSVVRSVDEVNESTHASIFVVALYQLLTLAGEFAFSVWRPTKCRFQLLFRSSLALSLTT